MPAKNTKRIRAYLTPDQIAAVNATKPGNISKLISTLLKKHVEDKLGDGTWPDSPGRGKYNRKNITQITNLIMSSRKEDCEYTERRWRDRMDEDS